MIAIDPIMLTRKELFMLTKRKNAHRLSVWLLIFSLLAMMAASAFTVHATPFVHGAENRTHEAGRTAGEMARGVADGVGDAARDAANGVGDAVRDVTDGAVDPHEGRVSDGDGVIGNEASPRADATTENQGRVGRIALIVVIVAAVIAVIIMVLIMPKKKRD